MIKKYEIVFEDAPIESDFGCWVDAEVAEKLYDALDELLQLTEIERPDWSHTEQHRARTALAQARGEAK